LGRIIFFKIAAFSFQVLYVQYSYVSYLKNMKTNGLNNLFSFWLIIFKEHSMLLFVN